MAYADADRHVPTRAEVVLRVPPELVVREADERIPDTPREGDGTSGEIAVEAGEGEGAARVLNLTAPVALCLEQRSEPERVASADVVEIVGELDSYGAPTSGHLSAPRREGAEHDHRWVGSGCRRAGVVPPGLEPDLVEHRPADRSALRHPEQTLDPIGVVRARGEVDAPDALVVAGL